MQEIEISLIDCSTRKRKMNPDKAVELARSILEVGLINPITVKEIKGRYILLAGAHRLQAYRHLMRTTIPAIVFVGDDLDAEMVEIDENLRRNDLTILEQSEHLQRRNEILDEIGMRARSGTNKKNTLRTGATVAPVEESETKTTSDIASEIGLSERSTRNRSQIARNIIPEVRDAIRETEIADSTTQLLSLARMKPEEQIKIADEVKASSNEEITLWDAVNEIKKREFIAMVQEQKEEIKRNDYKPPNRLYDVIVIDPPWNYETQYDPDGRRAANPYPEMTVDEIKAMKLPASKDCILWLWTTHKFMRYSFEILDAWGFRDVSILTWEKDRMGLGSWLRSQSEFCIMAVKGTPKVNLTNQTTIIHGAMREHSRKPDEFYSMVNNLCIGYKIDVFSREHREGWDQYGNDTAKF